MEKTIFISIDEKDRKSIIAQAIISREMELMQYELNIENYQRILDNPNTDVQFSQRISNLIQSEKVERAKSASVHASLLKTYPLSELVAAVAAEKIKGV